MRRSVSSVRVQTGSQVTLITLNKNTPLLCPHLPKFMAVDERVMEGLQRKKPRVHMSCRFSRKASEQT
jgi:hypothetical protein